MTQAKARFVIRFSGIDHDVSVRADDPVKPDASLANQIAFVLGPAALELSGLDAWAGAPANPTETKSKLVTLAQKALSETGPVAARLSTKWDLSPMRRAYGHVWQDGGWVDEIPMGTAPTRFKSAAILLHAKGSPNPYFEYVTVGGLLVQVDFWLLVRLV